MEEKTYARITKQRSFRIESSKQNKMIKRFYAQFLESLSRKTDSEKRTEVFGKDPFK